MTGPTWTTDGIYRETRERMRRRREEGCLTVEMEAAALFAVAAFRGVAIGQVLYAAICPATPLDERGWLGHAEGRGRLLWLAAESVLRLEG